MPTVFAIRLGPRLLVWTVWPWGSILVTMLGVETVALVESVRA